MISAQELSAGAEALGLLLSSTQEGLLLKYLDLLKKWNRTYSLTAIREDDKLVRYHLLDCLSVLPHLSATSLIDVGSGAGLPGIPLAIVSPQLRVVLLESNHKKGAFLRQSVLELELPNVEVVLERAETYHPNEKFDVAISRAFSDLASFADVSGRLIRRDGQLIAMKGVYPNEELAQVPSTMRIEKVIRLSIPGLQAERHLVLLRNRDSALAL